MATMNWGYLLRDAVQDGKIRELHLRNIPVLKNCRNWRDVKEIGSVDHKTKYAHYRGLLVRYGGGVYYISDEKVEALEPFRTWDKRKAIKVIETDK